MLTVAPVTVTQAGLRFRCVATNSGGAVPTTAARLSVVSAPVAPVVAIQSSGAGTSVGGTVTLTSTVTGTMPLTYQWQRNGADLPGAAQPTLVIVNAQAAHLGTYTLKVTNASETTTSGATPLTGLLNVPSPAALVFSATKAGASSSNFVSVTEPQGVTVTFTGATPSWTATADQPWVTLSGAAGTGAGRFTVSVANPGNVLGGTTAATATVTITAPSLGISTTVPVSLTVLLTTTGSVAPTGFFDTPANNATNVRGTIPVTGWAVDAIGVNRVEVWRNCVEAIDRPAGACMVASPGGPPNFVFVGRAIFVDGARPDVAALYPTVPFASRAGWGVLLMTNALPHVPNGTPQGGQGTFALSAYAINEAGQYTALGTKTIAVDNDHATLPFGAIDTPGPGAVIPESTAPYNNASGYPNFGWAMTQAGKCVVTTSTLAYQVFVDGVSQPLTAGANWFAGLTRADLTAAYPGLCNSSNALAVYYLNAAALPNGLHTMSWSVTDSAGQTAGLGSRYFTVLIAGSDPFGATANPQTSFVAIFPVNGVRTVQMDDLGRVELWLGAGVDAGYLVANGTLRDLPPGSHLDVATGQFTWAPGPGYLGTYRLAFVRNGERLTVDVTIRPPAGASQIQMFVDTPTDGAIVDGPTTIAGWALDPHAWTGAGIDAVHVWATRQDVGTAAQFLGAAQLNVSRPDVAAAFGGQFANAGYSLVAPTLDPGVYDLTIYAHSARKGQWEDARTVRVTVR